MMMPEKLKEKNSDFSICFYYFKLLLAPMNKSHVLVCVASSLKACMLPWIEIGFGNLHAFAILIYVF